MEQERALCDGILPLAGHRIGVTADRRAEEQGELLRRMGAEVTFGPMLRTLPLGDDTPLRSATEALLADPPTMVLLMTGIGVRSWIGAAETWGRAEDLVAMLSTAPVYARGPKAHAAAVQAGIPVWRREPSERLDAMVEHLTARSLTGAHLALQLYGNDVPWAVKALEAAGARVTTVPVYRWVPPDDEGPARRLIREAIDGQLAAVTFTCPAAARSTCRIADADGVLDDLLEAFESRVAAACVGPITEEATPRPRHPGRLLAERRPPRPARALVVHHAAARARPPADHRRRGGPAGVAGRHRHRAGSASRTGSGRCSPRWPADRGSSSRGPPSSGRCGARRPTTAPSTRCWPGCVAASPRPG